MDIDLNYTFWSMVPTCNKLIMNNSKTKKSDKLFLYKFIFYLKLEALNSKLEPLDSKLEALDLNIAWYSRFLCFEDRGSSHLSFELLSSYICTVQSVPRANWNHNIISTSVYMETAVHQLENKPLPALAL